jgi:hypothetical protein
MPVVPPSTSSIVKMGIWTLAAEAAFVAPLSGVEVRRKFSLSARRRSAVSRCVQARQQHFDVFTMNRGSCSISIEQDADAVGVDTSSDNRAGLVGEARTA